jgi:hypothetical protein
MYKTDEVAVVAERTAIDAPSCPQERRATLRPWVIGVVVATGSVAVLALTGVRWLNGPAVAAWRTVCLAITVQALPFLLLGTLLSGAINAFVPADLFTRVLARHWPSRWPVWQEPSCPAASARPCRSPAA